MDDTSARGPARHPNGRFGPGNPGRPAGSRNRMSKHIALGLMRHYAEHEAEILEQLRRYYLSDFMRLVGRMLPRGPGEGEADLEAAPPAEVAEVTTRVRQALDRIDAGEASLAEIEAALLGFTCAESPTDLNDESTAPGPPASRIDDYPGRR